MGSTHRPLTLPSKASQRLASPRLVRPASYHRRAPGPRRSPRTPGQRSTRSMRASVPVGTSAPMHGGPGAPRRSARHRARWLPPDPRTLPQPARAPLGGHDGPRGATWPAPSRSLPSTRQRAGDGSGVGALAFPSDPCGLLLTVGSSQFCPGHPSCLAQALQARAQSFVRHRSASLTDADRTARPRPRAARRLPSRSS
jgi:hypothetical protein